MVAFSISETGAVREDSPCFFAGFLGGGVRMTYLCNIIIIATLGFLNVDLFSYVDVRGSGQ